MIRISKLLSLLIALSITATVSLANKNVNLILPAIIGAKVDHCENNAIISTICNFTVWTRANEYKLIDFDLEKFNRSGRIERNGNWNEPKNIRDGQEIVRNNKRTPITDEMGKAKGWVSQRATTNTITPLTGKVMNWRICDAYTILESDQTELCVHDGALSVLSKDGKTAGTMPMQMYFEAGDKLLSAPITAMVALPREKFKPTNVRRIELVLFDAVGRMHICRFEINDLASKWVLNNGQSLDAHQFIDLSSIQSPSTGVLARQWQLRNNYMSSSLQSKFANRLPEKMASSYVEAITPIFMKTQRIGNLTKRSSYYFRQATENVTLPVLPSDDSIALCFSRAYRMYELRSNMVCLYKGEDQSALVEQPVINLPEPLTKDNTPAHIIHAYHIGSESGKRYFHLFYTYSPTGFVGSGRIYYLFCSRDGELTGQPGIKGDDLILNSAVGQSGCVPRTDKILSPPNDVIGFTYEKCNKVIAFYDFIYTVSNISTPLDTIEGPGKILPNLNFKISAAFSLGNKIYFFTQSNLLLIVEASMNSDCSELKLNMNSMKQMFSEDFIFKNAFQKFGQSPLSAPYLLDYRDYEQGASDTNPPADLSSPEPINPPGGGGGGAGGAGGKPAAKKGSSNIVIIAIGLIIGGLIIAAIIYLFCLKGKNDDDREPIRVRKSRKSPKVDPDFMIKTVRSKHAISSPPSKLRSELSKGSKINVIQKSVKSHKSPKSTESPKLQKVPKSQISPSARKSPKSPISLKSHKSTKSPVSQKSVKQSK